MVVRLSIFLVLTFAVQTASADLSADPNSSESHVLPELTVTSPGHFGYTTLPEIDLIWPH